MSRFTKKQQSAYPLLATLKKLGRPLTRENYLALDGWDNPTPDLTAEEELDLPPQFRRSSCPTEEDPLEKPEVPEVTPRDKQPEVTVTYTRRVLTPEQRGRRLPPRRHTSGSGRHRHFVRPEPDFQT